MTPIGWRLIAVVTLLFVSPESECGEPEPQFADVFSAVGGTFRHVSPLTEARHIHLTMESGVACFDYNNDGWCDLLFGQGCAWNGAFRSADKTQDALFRNRAGILSNVTDLSGLHNPWYAMGIQGTFRCPADQCRRWHVHRCVAAGGGSICRFLAGSRRRHTGF